MMNKVRNQPLVLAISLTILAIVLAGCAFVADEQGIKIADPEALRRMSGGGLRGEAEESQ